MHYEYCRIAKSATHGTEIHSFISELSMSSALKKAKAQFTLPPHLRSFKQDEKILFRVRNGGTIVLCADVVNFGNNAD